jgi:histidine kinase
MRETLFSLRHSLFAKIMFAAGSMLLLGVGALSLLNLRSQNSLLMDNILAGGDRLMNTIRLGTHYAMMLNSRDDIAQIIANISRQPEIRSIRIYNKAGRIKFSSHPEEVDRQTNIRHEACNVCHRTAPPRLRLPLEDRTRIFTDDRGERFLGILSPVYNEPSCADAACHVHPADKQVLGALDLVVSLADVDREMALYEQRTTGLAAAVFLITGLAIFGSVLVFVNRPIKRLITDTRRIGRGEHPDRPAVIREDEIGELARAIFQMSNEIRAKHNELHREKDKYQNLFEHVPCLITVQDRNFRLLDYNREFKDTFDPVPGDFCFHAYKGRGTKCRNCPVERTFKDGRSHYSEETGYAGDGSDAHWLVTTAPIRNPDGQVVAAMEMCLDITSLRRLEERLKLSEQKYRTIFNNAPGAIFVLDPDTLNILDCNEGVTPVYGYPRQELQNTSFLALFRESEQRVYQDRLRTSPVIEQARHRTADGGRIFVSIRISPAREGEQDVLLVITTDITKRLEVEQQLIQAGKMATLGEMATGVAHELNQPLSVIKTAAGFLKRRVRNGQPVPESTLAAMTEEIDHNVNRASGIITHMRDFGHKGRIEMEAVQLNTVLTRAFDLFSRQLRLREIEVVRELSSELPLIRANAGRLEQVFVNLLINARDAIEAAWDGREYGQGDKRITLRTYHQKTLVFVEVADTGTGIPPEIEDRLFEPFFTTKEVGKGTGLGLSISYGIVEECGGSITGFTNRFGGATFLLKFPVLGA